MADQQQFANLVGRIFTDPQFADALERNPEQALQQAGITLSAEQRSAIARQQGSHADAAAARAIVMPAVRVLTRPVVQVAVNAVTGAMSREEER